MPESIILVAAAFFPVFPGVPLRSDGEKELSLEVAVISFLALFGLGFFLAEAGEGPGLNAPWRMTDFITKSFHKRRNAMKKFLALLLALMMVLSLCACGSKPAAEAPAAEAPAADAPAA